MATPATALLDELQQLDAALARSLAVGLLDELAAPLRRRGELVAMVAGLPVGAEQLTAVRDSGRRLREAIAEHRKELAQQCLEAQRCGRRLRELSPSNTPEPVRLDCHG